MCAALRQKAVEVPLDWCPLLGTQRCLPKEARSSCHVAKPRLKTANQLFPIDSATVSIRPSDQRYPLFYLPLPFQRPVFSNADIPVR